MSCCTSSSKRTPFAADAGKEAPVETNRDPFEVLDDLMVVVEALCPTWPARDTLTEGEQFRL